VAANRGYHNINYFFDCFQKTLVDLTRKQSLSVQAPGNARASSGA